LKFPKGGKSAEVKEDKKSRMLKGKKTGDKMSKSMKAEKGGKKEKESKKKKCHKGGPKLVDITDLDGVEFTTTFSFVFGFPATLAFDNNSTTEWVTNETDPEVIITLPDDISSIVTTYSIQSTDDEAIYSNPRNWTLSCNIGRDTYVIIDTVTDFVFSISNEIGTFSVDRTETCINYKLTFTDSSSTELPMAIAEISLFGVVVDRPATPSPTAIPSSVPSAAPTVSKMPSASNMPTPTLTNGTNATRRGALFRSLSQEKPDSSGLIICEKWRGIRCLTIIYSTVEGSSSLFTKIGAHLPSRCGGCAGF